jgi:hypothetical protein
MIRPGDKVYKVGTELGGIVKSVNPRSAKVLLLGTNRVIKIKLGKVKPL